MEHGTRDRQHAQRPEGVSLGELIHQHVRVAVEHAVQEELTALLDVGRYERRATRRGYRNGLKRRTLTGSTGPLGLTLPRGPRVHTERAEGVGVDRRPALPASGRSRAPWTPGRRGRSPSWTSSASTSTRSGSAARSMRDTALRDSGAALSRGCSAPLEPARVRSGQVDHRHGRVDLPQPATPRAGPPPARPTRASSARGPSGVRASCAACRRTGPSC
jgi:Transposase, Mutator family